LDMLSSNGVLLSENDLSAENFPNIASDHSKSILDRKILAPKKSLNIWTNPFEFAGAF
jgi:hypothetical protein